MKPNIIYILCDDMGYGDMLCNDPKCRIPTPNLNALAERGMRFTNAHAGSSVCTPSRYNILTGRYTWRSRLKRGIVWEWDGALIEPDRLTAPGLLRTQGYDTACIGKWHVGWDWPTKDGRHPNETLPFGVAALDRRAAFKDRIDLGGRIEGGPVDRGFNSYFGVDVPNFPPYTWFENDRLAEIPTVPKPDSMYGHPGLMLPDWSLEAMIPEFTRRAVDYIEDRALREDGTPFFLYFPLTSPHSPVVPNEGFKGMSGIGNYGDFVCEIDWVVGEVTAALERGGIADDTLVIFTSDNGPESRTPDDEGVYARAERTGHFSMGSWRGMKRDAWEGGHREPFLAAWPSVVPAGSVCDQLVGLGDFMATCADITGAALPEDAGEDSVSMLPLLRGRTDRPTRDELVHHSCSGKFAIRTGDWVLIDDPCGGDNEEPDWFTSERGYEAHGQYGELYDLRKDPAERHNLYGERPDMVKDMKARLEDVKNS
jgi:arylsulfatase A